MQRGQCRHCGAETDLLHSHIIPKFVYRWIAKDGPTRYLRTNEAPNKRQQDGPKRFWLCAECEQLFGGFETEFARTIFHPTIERGHHPILYREWLMKFCVSISWRTLLLTKEIYGFDTWPDLHRAQAEMALKTWRAFLCGKITHPGEFEQHLLVFGAWTDPPPDAPPNINFYLHTAIELDICLGSNIANTFVKFGPFILLGFFVLEHPSEWRSSKVQLKRGQVAAGKYRLPGTFRDLLFEKARGMTQVYKQISPGQKELINDAWKTNADQISVSRALRVIQLDLAIFGEAARDAF